MELSPDVVLCVLTPIVVDVEGDGYELTSAGEGVVFDIGAVGRPLRVAWIRGDEAWLVLDRDGDGMIEDGSELFGNATRLRSGERASHGFVALEEFDANGDGVITAADPVYGRLRLWQDANRDGVSQASEVIPLAQRQIGGIEVRSQESRRRDRHGSEFRYRAKVYRSLSPSRADRFAYDVILTYQLLQ